MINQDEKHDLYILKPEEELNSFIEKYGDKRPEITSETTEPSKQKQTKKIIKECEICGNKLPVSQFYTSTTSDDGYNSKCKDCSKKSHAITALEEIKAYVGPEDTPFNKDDLSNQFEDRMKFLDYIWTLQEFDLIIHDEKLDVYALNSEDKLNSFVEKYGDKPAEKQEEHAEPEGLKPEVSIPQVKNPYEKELLDDGFKECELCGKSLPISNFYRILNN